MIRLKHIYRLLVLSLVFIAILTACGVKAVDNTHRTEAGSYFEKTVDVQLPLQMDFQCDYGKIEVFNWDKAAVKFEITNKVRGSLSDQELQKRLEKFRTDISYDGSRLFFKNAYKGKDGRYEDTFSEMYVYLPRRVMSMEYGLRQGTLKFVDDLNCDLKISVENARVEINKLAGGINYTGKAGSLRISAGEIRNNSNIAIDNGIIRIKSFFETPGNFAITTGTGIIELELPAGLPAVFDSNGRVEEDGAVNEGSTSKFILKCGLGKIDVKRF